MKRIAKALAVVPLLLSSAYAIDDQTVVVQGQDAAMLEATRTALVSLDGFLSKQEKPPKGATQFRLKVKFQADKMVEHMWVMPFKRSGDGFVGILADEPVYAKSLKNGQKVEFSRAEISDWGYAQDGKQKGSFTVCVLFKKMPPAEVKLYREQYGFEC
jgi:uncharacterized protein YegJ (DUF2314 family)